MRFALGVAGLLLVLTGCAPIGVDSTGMTAGSPTAGADRSEGAAIGGDFDYRYAFRLPAARIAEVQDSHVRACDQLGRARCRVLTNRYHVNDQDNSVSAVLAFQIDPVLARNFGRDAGAAVKASAGLVMDSRMIGSDSAVRTGGIVARLREEIANLDTKLKGNLTDAQRAEATAKQTQLRAAVATISDLDQSSSQGMATTPMLFTYQSGTVIPALGGSSSATFDNAGQAFVQSAAAMAQVLAGVGPWLLVLLGVALILRRFVQPDEPENHQAVGVPLPPSEESRSVVRRWFGRDAEHETVESEPVS
ncbi:hypothetical protein [Sphingomonas sp. 28-63-12]|uniref:hypothetical protein n=1 Tax=Sphingomonas sp. 28-63-12 TaxID=1970434 RepID=UPI000BC9DD61|nr:MAG: hypothetical protein B7Y47_14820 [Sphingomonas sp. 28-63-12]